MTSRTEDLPGFAHGRQLKFLLRAEVGVDAALAHVERAGEVTDRETFQPVDRRQRHRLAHDRGSGPLAVGSLLLRHHLDKIARSVVL